MLAKLAREACESSKDKDTFIGRHYIKLLAAIPVAAVILGIYFSMR